MDDPQREALPAAPPTAPRGGRFIGSLALLIALAAGAAVYWMWQVQQASAVSLRELQSTLARLPPPAVDRSAELLGDIESLRGPLAALEARTVALEDAGRRIQAAVDGSTGRDTRMAEAEYLQRMAAQSLLMGREVRGAIALLEASDEILLSLDDPALHDARAQLASDLATLRAAAAFDTEGTWLRLSALVAQVPALVLSERHLPEGGTPAPPGQGWSARVLELLGRFVVIRHDAGPARPLPAAMDESMLRMAVRLGLEQAKLALMAARQQPYAGALAEVAELVRGSFDPSAAVNRAFTDELRQLGAEQIAVPMPDISGSLRALRKAAAARSDAG